MSLIASERVNRPDFIKFEHFVVMKKILSNLFSVITLIVKFPFIVNMNYQPNHSMYSNNCYVTRFRKPLVYITMFLELRDHIIIECPSP